MTDESAAQIWRNMVDAIMSGDLDRARTMVVDQLEWEVMGRFPYAGKYNHVEGLAELLQGVREGSGNTFHMTPELSVSDENTAAVVGHVTASRAGKTLEAKNVFIVQCEGGKVARGWTIPVDQYAYDAFWE